MQTSSVIWLSSYKCHRQPSLLHQEPLQPWPNPLAPGRLTDSCSFNGYSQRSPEASPKAARYGVKRGGDNIFGGRQTQPRSATRCQHISLLPEGCQPYTVQSREQEESADAATHRNHSSERQADAHPSHSISHSNWKSGTTVPALSPTRPACYPQLHNA